MEHHFSVWAKANIAGSRFYIKIVEDGGSGTYVLSNETAPSGTWQEYRGSYVPPAGTQKVTGIQVFPLHSNGTQSPDGVQWFGAFTLTEKTTAVTIADGAITTPKLDVTETMSARIVNAMSLTAKKGIFTDGLQATDATLLGTTVAQALSVKKLTARDVIVPGTIDVAQLNVTQSMSASIVNAMDIAARRGFFTEGLTAAEATLLGTTVAERLNVTGKLVGRDAILTGTVDVAQLNVTSVMSAEIARVMDLTAKKLIVTDEAILNRATVVQDLVTSELIANRVDSRYLRSDSIQTGLLEVYGRFRTAPAGLPQIIIQPSQTAWNNKDLGIWFTPDGSTPGGGNADQASVTGGIWMNPTSDTGTTWQPRKLNLRGQSRAGVTVYDSMEILTTKGNLEGAILTAGGGQRLTIGGYGILFDSADVQYINAKNDVQIRSENSYVNLTAGAGIDIFCGTAKGIHLRTGGTPIAFTSQNTSSGYGHTTASGANAYINPSNGFLYRSTSSRRYKKDIGEWGFNASKLRDVRLRRFRDKDAGVSGRLHAGAVAEEVAELFPEVVPTVPDPNVRLANGDQDPDAPQVPDSIEYDRLALAAAVAGYQDLDRRLRAIEGKGA